MVQLIKKIRVHAEGADESGELSQFFPQFIWLLRDFQVGSKAVAARLLGAARLLLAAELLRHGWCWVVGLVRKVGCGW